MQHTVAGSTATDYYNHIVNHINPYIGKIKLTELNAAHLSALYKKLHIQGYAPRTINLVHCVIRSALRSAYDLNLINRNVATSKEVWKPKILKHEAHLYSVPQVKELLQVFENCPADDPKKIYADCLTVVLSLGVRRGEGLGLKFKDFDLTTNKVYINTQVAPARTEEDTAIAANPTDNGLPKPKTQVQLTGLKTQSAYRWINVPEPIIDIVKKRMLIVQKQKQIYGSAYEDNDLVFCKENGHWLQPNQLNTNYNTFVAMTGLKYSTPHDLRHSYATNLLDADMPVKVISSNLGHSTVRITMDIYADSIIKKEQSAQVVSDLYFK